MVESSKKRTRFHDNSATSCNSWSPFPCWRRKTYTIWFNEVIVTRLVVVCLRTKHKQWIVPWNDLANDANWLLAGVCEIRSIDWNGFAGMLITPTSIIAECRNTAMNIENAPCNRFTCVSGQSKKKLFALRMVDYPHKKSFV